MFIAKELLRLVNDEEGLTTVEYAIAGALVASVVVLSFTNLGQAVANRIQSLADIVSSGSGT
ncbi:pilus assembly protein [Oceanimonas sp. CHS3-5]|uniref:Flp family type IVb pilin n=1 Tax=Oceanimonas sp. CHS3-5 TaxID=3068186 RepID=UPI00273F6362|nr:pilus assembly protein [Oceanimonas sp. CHS3-5]MDP5291061.1 pilus assembly protein [Oceanimonas sp. CHS3-5]